MSIRIGDVFGMTRFGMKADYLVVVGLAYGNILLAGVNKMGEVVTVASYDKEKLVNRRRIGTATGVMGHGLFKLDLKIEETELGVIKAPEFYMAHESTGSFYWIENNVNMTCPMNLDGSPDWDSACACDLNQIEDPHIRNEVAAALSGVFNTHDQVKPLKDRIRESLPY